METNLPTFLQRMLLSYCSYKESSYYSLSNNILSEAFSFYNSKPVFLKVIFDPPKKLTLFKNNLIFCYKIVIVVPIFCMLLY